MHKRLVPLLSALILLGTLATTGANPFISPDQSVNFSANGFYLWAMIWDYTHGWRESATPGAVNYDYGLGYRMPEFDEVHVAYLYGWALGRYIEAQALRDVRFWNPARR